MNNYTPNNYNYTCVNQYHSTQTTGRGNTALLEIQKNKSKDANQHAQDYAKAFWDAEPKGLTLAGAGGIGAGVTLATVGLVILAGWATGAIAFGSRRASALRAYNNEIRETKSVGSA